MNPRKLWKDMVTAQKAWEAFADRARLIVEKGHKITGRGDSTHQWTGCVDLHGKMVRVTIMEDIDGDVPHWVQTLSGLHSIEEVDVITFPLRWINLPDEVWMAELEVQHKIYTEIKRQTVATELAAAAEKARLKKVREAIKVLKDNDPSILKETA